MSKKIEPMMGINAREYLGGIRGDAGADRLAISGSDGKLNSSSKGLRLRYEGCAPGDVEARTGRALRIINPDVCMSELQVSWVRSLLFVSREGGVKTDVDTWAPAINSFRLDCDRCLRKNCPQRDPETSSDKATDKTEIKSKSVVECGFTPRIEDRLKEANILTIGALCDLSERELLRTCKNLGRKGLREIKAFLTEHGLGLRES